MIDLDRDDVEERGGDWGNVRKDLMVDLIGAFLQGDGNE